MPLDIHKERSFIEKGDNLEEPEKVFCVKRERKTKENWKRAVLVVEAIRAQSGVDVGEERNLAQFIQRTYSRILRK